MKCIVTGGAGFIGSHLVDLLINNNHEVVVIDNLISGRLKNLSLAAKSQNFKFIHADIRNIDEISSVFNGVDWVFHLAGMADIVPSIENPSDYFSTNVTGTLNVLQCSVLNNVRRFIYAASSSCYGIPENYPTSECAPIKPQYPYALTKYMGEELVLHWASLYKIPALSLRLFNVYGVRSRTTGAYGAVFGVFLAQKLNNKPLTIVGDGSQTRDFTYVSDVVNAFLAAAESQSTGEVVNVGSGSHYSIEELAALLGGEVEYIPKRPGEPDCTFADITKIQHLLGWKPQVSFVDGVKRMVSNIDDWRDAPIWNSSKIEQATKSWFKYLGGKL
jgi:UDP-glucose 4-epimerase